MSCIDYIIVYIIMSIQEFKILRVAQNTLSVSLRYLSDKLPLAKQAEEFLVYHFIFGVLCGHQDFLKPQVLLYRKHIERQRFMIYGFTKRRQKLLFSFERMTAIFYLCTFTLLRKLM